MDTLGTRIRSARDAMKLTQEQLAHQSGLTGMTVSNIERAGDAAKPRPQTLLSIARVLGVSVDWLLTGEGQGPASSEAS